MVNNRKKSVVHIYEVGYHGAENRNGKTYIFLKRGKIPFLPLKYFCVVVDGDIDQDEAECDVDDDENDGSDDQH